MKTIKVQAFTVQELKDEPRENAMEWLRSAEFFGSPWADHVIEGWLEVLSREGFTNADIEFSGFCSQGDGASFTSSVDLGAWIERSKEREKFAALVELGVTAQIKRSSSNYVNSNTIYADIGTEYSDTTYKENALLLELEEALNVNARDLSNQIYRMLEMEYDHLSSEESLIKSAEINDYLFDKYGKPIHHLA